MAVERARERERVSLFATLQYPFTTKWHNTFSYCSNFICSPFLINPGRMNLSKPTHISQAKNFMSENGFYYLFSSINDFSHISDFSDNSDTIFWNNNTYNTINTDNNNENSLKTGKKHQSFEAKRRQFASTSRQFAIKCQHFTSTSQPFASSGRQFASKIRSFGSTCQPFALTSRLVASNCRQFATKRQRFALNKSCFFYDFTKNEFSISQTNKLFTN